MPPLFTSTSWTTLVRKVASAMVYAPKPAVAIKVTPKRTTINHIQKVRQVIQQSFPSLSIPSHQLNHSYATIPLKSSSSRQFSSSTKAAKRLGPVRQGLNQVGARPRWVNGPSIQANVGLGKARTFVSSTYPTAQNVVNGKVPMVFRAFVSLMEDEENKLSGKKGLPKASRYTPYIKSKSARRIRRSSTRSIDSSFIEDLKHYFPLPTRPSSQEITVALPLLPETLITEGKTTVLALPLSPSLEALLLPTSQIRYDETEIGISILSRLTRGLLSIHNAFSLHSSTRIIPLLNKLDGLGVLDYHPDGLGRVEAEVVNDGEDQPDILRLIFHHRSISDVRTLLGESLRENEEGQWWALYDNSRLEMELNQNERKEIMENWSSPLVQPIIPQAQSNEQLVFPTLDMSQGGEVLFDISESTLSSPSDSWPSTPSGSSTPLPIDSPVSEFDPNDDASMSMLSSTGSLTESLLSRLSSSDESQGVWSVHPSDSDSDVESSSVFSQEVEEWNAVDQIISSPNGDEEEVEEVMVSWSGSGEGFGFLAQPW